MLRGLCLFVILAGAALPARADDGKARALKLFADSDKAYKNGDFERAVALLREAYGLHAEPLLLYNLARALEGMGDARGAVEAYEHYLAAQAVIEDRGAIERRVATLKEQLAAQDAKLAPPPPPEPRSTPREQPQPPPPPRVHHSPLPAITIGGGVAIGLTGGAFALFARSRHAAAIEEPKQADAESLNDAAQRYATTANVLMIAGGAVTVAGVVWLIVDRSRSPAVDAKVGLVVGPGSIGIAGVWP